MVSRAPVADFVAQDLSQPTRSHIDAVRLAASRQLATVAAALAMVPVYLFIYNSGYGYDAFEYLIIGQSLNDGVPFYTFVPSKSWALYGLVAAYLHAPAAATHAGVALLVTATVLMVVVATYLVATARGLGTIGARTAALLVAANALFSELNYLEPTGFVYLSGLLAFAAVSGPKAERARAPWLLAGVWIGVGVAFKAVAAFYLIAIFCWLVWQASATKSRGPLQNALYVTVGVAFTVAAQALYFWSSGRLEAFLEWSFVFPLLHYPANTEWVAKLYTKLLWVIVVIALAGAISLDARVRGRLYRDKNVWLLLSFGSCAVVPLLKTQSSHYAFPGTAFLLIYAAVVFERWIDARRAWRLRSSVAVVAIVAAAIVISGVLYRPSALRRFFDVRSYSEEQALCDSLQALVKPDEHFISFSQGTRLYWLSRRYPNWPLLNTDVQSSYYIERHSDELWRALDDSRLTLIEFDPASTTFDDARFLDHAANRSFVATLTCRLEAGFSRRDDLAPPLVLWTRRTTRSDSGRCRS